MEYPSIDRAEIVLEMYDKQKTLAHSELLSGINYDGMPKGTPKGNPSVNALTERITASNYIKTIKTAIDLIEDDYPEYAIYLRENYMQHKSKTAIAVDMSVSRATVYNLAEKAMMEFAKIIPDEIAEYAETLTVK
ncbi:hypothetical protein ERK14_06775 [Lactobacillus kunkeei]|nr:hypothetical protein [Apilactobacillus kunkeei]